MEPRERLLFSFLFDYELHNMVDCVKDQKRGRYQ